MRILLDTHVLLWAATAPERLGDALELLREGERLVSVASVWELAIKQDLDKIDLGQPAGAWVRFASIELGASLLAITAEHAAGVEGLPPIHRDPFDRLLVSQARSERVTLLTADSTVADYGESVRLI